VSCVLIRESKTGDVIGDYWLSYPNPHADRGRAQAPPVGGVVRTSLLSFNGMHSGYQRHGRPECVVSWGSTQRVVSCFRRCHPVEFCRAVRELVGDAVDGSVLVERGEAGTLGSTGGNSPLVFLVRAALPRASRVAEVDRHRRVDAKSACSGHIIALVQVAIVATRTAAVGRSSPVGGVGDDIGRVIFGRAMSITKGSASTKRRDSRSRMSDAQDAPSSDGHRTA